jgi:hypothetical protein
MFSDSLLLLERSHLLALAIWAHASVLAGTILLIWLSRRGDRSPLLFHFAVQTALWGAGAVAYVALRWHGLGMRDLAAATRLDHQLWLATGLDLGAVPCLMRDSSRGSRGSCRGATTGAVSSVCRP